MMSPKLRFDSHYREQVLAADGTRLLLRMLHPEDKPKLADGFRRLSPQSRYRRFFTLKNSLSPGDLLFFTEFDGVNHLAIGAAYLDEQGNEGDGVGVARCIRFSDQPAIAEFAVAVVDEMQNKGIGKLLCERLIAAAAERGIERFRCDLLAENQPALALVKTLCGNAVFHRNGSQLTAEFPIACSLESMQVPAAQGAFDILRHTAQGVITAKPSAGSVKLAAKKHNKP